MRTEVFEFRHSRVDRECWERPRFSHNELAHVVHLVQVDMCIRERMVVRPWFKTRHLGDCEQ